MDFFVNAADLLGVPKSVAALYGVVFAAAEPVSFAEIEARLDISKGSISQGLRVLSEVGAIKEVSAASDRAEFFDADDSDGLITKHTKIRGEEAKRLAQKKLTVQ